MAQFYFKGVWYVVTENGDVYSLATKGSDSPSNWRWQFVWNLEGRS